VFGKTPSLDAIGEVRLSDLAAKMDSLEAQIASLSHKVQEIRSLVGPVGVAFPDGNLLTQTIHGLKYFVDPDDLIITPQMIVYRQWEADLSQLFYQLCNRDTVFVDVGANFGYFTVLAANIIGQSGQGKVFAFEPNPKLAALLRKNIEINWSIAPIAFFEAAAADVTGEVVLHVPKDHSANASLTAPDETTCDSEYVRAMRLADALPRDVAIDLMKIDVEGHELTVLKGARDVIDRSGNLHLIMEWSRKQMQQAGSDANEIFALLGGFRPYRIELGQPAKAHPESREWLMAQDYTDVLFART